VCWGIGNSVKRKEGRKEKTAHFMEKKREGKCEIKYIIPEMNESIAER
jgi:hypothetical protein